jgi:hypothetical protein
VNLYHGRVGITTGDTQTALDQLNATITLLLPETYQASYEALQPVSMRSAGLVYDDDGRVAWDRIWGSFCDLAMAGGPPHKGRLLEPATRAAVDAAPDRYDDVTCDFRRARLGGRRLLQRRHGGLARARHRDGERGRHGRRPTLAAAGPA